MDEEIIYWLALGAVNGVGPSLFVRLINRFGSPRAVFQASSDELEELSRPSLIEKLRSFSDFQKFEKEIQKLKENDIKVVTYRDPLYPFRLKQISSFPPLLYVRGDFSKIPNADWLGVVGSRKISPYGISATKRIVKELVLSHLVIVSGFALGVDITAHLAALENGGFTVAVLGSGLNQISPPSHKKYLKPLLERGIMISEFPFDLEARPEFFPRRNRIISGLSRGVLVVEAAQRSGALITAEYALEQNRDLFAVPGPITSPVSAGPHRLIQQGAKLITSGNDILSEWKYPVVVAHSPSVSFSIDPEEKAIIDSCRLEPVTSDQILERTGFPSHKISMMITKLELEGKIKALEGRRFRSVEE